MPQQLSDKQQQEIWDAYQKEGSINKAADVVDHSKATVRKYVNKFKEAEEDDDDYEDTEDDTAKLDFGQIGMPDAQAEMGVDLNGLEPGEFIEWYFTEDLGEIDVEGIGLFARRCNSKRAVPTERQMAELLDRMPSKVGNNLQIDWIAEDYWGRAVEYIATKTGAEPQAVRNKANSQNLAWMRVPKRNRSQYAGSPNNGQGGIGTVGQQNQQQQQGRGVGTPPGGTQPEDSRMGQPPQGNQYNGGQQGGGQAQIMQQMVEEMRRERQEMMQMMKESMAGGQSRGGEEKGLSDQLQEIAQIQETLDSFNGDDEQIQQVASALQQEIQQIRAQVENGSGGGTPDDPINAAMANLAQREDVDPEVLASIATSAQAESSPEVQKKKMDMEIEKMKHERREQMMDKFMDGLEDIASNASGLAELASGVSSEPEPQVPQEPEPEPKPREETPSFSISDSEDTGKSGEDEAEEAENGPEPDETDDEEAENEADDDE
jgi:hypothetical protein